MLLLRIAAAAHCFSQPLRHLLHSAQQAGLQGLQFDVRNELKPSEMTATGRRQFLHQLNELGLSVSSLSFPARRSFYNPDHLDARISALKTAMEFAWELKALTVTSRIGKIPLDKESTEYVLLVEVLNDLARHANRIGTVLAITPTNDSADALAELLATVTEGPIGVNFDPASFVMSGRHAVDAFRTLHSGVNHVTIRDGLQEVDGGGVEVPVGRGEVEWDELLALLDEAPYRGWLTIDRTSGEDQLGDVVRAAQYLRRVAMGD